jgi:hypothetical protein
MKRLFACLMLTFLIAMPSFATTVERLTLDDMVKKAQSIVHGKVRGARTHWSANGKLILTTYTIDVSENIKGQGSKTVELTTIGGRIGDTTLYVSGMPSFQTGEDAVVFVEKSAGFSTVVGLSQGKFAVANGEVSNNVSALSFADGRKGVPLKMRLEDFKREISNRLNR